MSYLLPNSFHDHHHPEPSPTTSTAPAPARSPARQDMSPTAIHQPFPSHPLPQATLSSASYSTDHTPSQMPKVGQTRCYWAILSSDLQFIYLDPVLASHLEDQAELLVGKSILSFVHPDEQASAKQDLGGVLESRTLHGSVTRARFSRLSNVRRQLGHEGPGSSWSDADKIAVDKDYMVVDIVINWAAEGLVLCFIHASVDLAPEDNDEVQRTEWTNWCGTPSMSMEQIQLLYRRLLVCIPQTGTMSRVFQILSNERDRPLLISWPPDPSQGPTSRDFAKLVENVQIGREVTGGNDAKTSCTRRYRALQDMPPLFGGEVESIFIPHDSIIFACHKVNPAPRINTNPSAPMQQVEYAPASYPSQQNPPYYEHSSSYPLPPLSTSGQAYNSAFIQQPGPAVQPQPSYSPQRWAQAPLPPTVSNLRSGSYSATSPTQSTQSWPSGPPSASYLESGPPSPFNRAPSPAYTHNTATGTNSVGTSPTSDVVPPPRRRISPTTSSREPRTAGNRPTGVQKCSSCKATSSPEWRKGPSGKKELCNACGLRYARSRAKKEGPNPVQTQQRRRKEKASTIRRESTTPPTLPAYSAIRRNYADSSFSTSSAGSASGSDIYPHSGPHVVDNMTPSPSPPTSNMNFVHYSGGSDNRPPYSTGTASSFYSIPSPLSNPHVLQQAPPTQHINTTQLPPLGQLSSYADRTSPMMPSASSLTHSSLTSTLPPASYERERERDNRDRDYRELPPTPLSAEPRINRRSILTQQ